jgi:peptide deformylase
VILHEYDHIEGILFTDKISKFKRTLIQKKLNKISSGNIDVKYPMKFSKK